MKKVTIIRAIIIAMFVISISACIAIDVIFNNSFVNLIFFCFLFVVWCLGGAYLTDYMYKHDLFNDVLGKYIIDIINDDEE